jgi:hypothetical protein
VGWLVLQVMAVAMLVTAVVVVRRRFRRPGIDRARTAVVLAVRCCACHGRCSRPAAALTADPTERRTARVGEGCSFRRPSACRSTFWLRPTSPRTHRCVIKGDYSKCRPARWARTEAGWSAPCLAGQRRRITAPPPPQNRTCTISMHPAQASPRTSVESTPYGAGSVSDIVLRSDHRTEGGECVTRGGRDHIAQLAESNGWLASSRSGGVPEKRSWWHNGMVL